MWIESNQRLNKGWKLDDVAWALELFDFYRRFEKNRLIIRRL